MGTYEMFQGKKASFSELMNAEDQNLHNSNMLNLVSAVRKIEDEQEQIKERQKFLTELKEEITVYANSGNVTDTDKVSRLFNKQQEGLAEPIKRRRW